MIPLAGSEIRAVRQPVAAPWDEARRLWSLWEIMEPFHPGSWLAVADLLARYRDRRNSNSSQVIEKRNTELSSKYKVFMSETFTVLRNDCIKHSCKASAATVGRMIDAINSEGSTFGDLYDASDELFGRLRDEMVSTSFLSLTTKEAEYYNNPKDGWETTIGRFPEIAQDVEEASKCFALARYAGAVFHSLQVAECGIIALGERVGVNDPNPGWGATINALNKIMKTKRSDRTDYQNANFQFFEQIHMAILAMSNAWRNKVSHANNKLRLMTADFSPYVAEEIISATRAFMRRLATEMPEPES